MCQLHKLGQDIEVCQFRELVRREHEVPQVRDRGRQAGLDSGDAVAREQEGADAGREGEVAEDLDVVVRQVKGIVWLYIQVSSRITREREKETNIPPQLQDSQ